MNANALLPPRLMTLLEAAVRAPSADNTQPWRFTVDPDAGLIALNVDAAREQPPLDIGQRMARIAVGSALENILHTAQVNDWQVELIENQRLHQALVRVLDPHGPGGIADSIIEARTTNRRLYDARPLAAEVLA